MPNRTEDFRIYTVKNAERILDQLDNIPARFKPARVARVAQLLLDYADFLDRPTLFNAPLRAGPHRSPRRVITEKPPSPND